MELRQIKFFMAVAEERHFGRAAERMYIAQPALSQHVRRLERELGVRLFDRSARHVRLTPAGEAFLAVARWMSRQVDEATLAARRAEAGEAGSVGIGVHVSVAAPILSVVLRHWSRLRPAIRPRLMSGRAGELVDLVRRGELDVALVDGPVTDRGLTSALVIEDRMVIVLPADHRLARHETVLIRSLEGEQFVSVARRSSVTLHDRFIELCGAAGFSPEVSVELDDPDLLPLAVAAGLGVGLAASALVAGRVMPGVVSRPLDDARAAIPLVAVAAREGATVQAQEFIHLVQNLHPGGRLLHSATVDLTDPPGGVPVPIGPATLVLQPAV
ncbi:MAG TPA: LysR substrate-binding domain-containing protein [Acidimicrobiia bacterium]